MRYIRICVRSLDLQGTRHGTAVVAAIGALAMTLSSCGPAVNARPEQRPTFAAAPPVVAQRAPADGEDIEAVRRVSQHRYSRIIGARAADIDIAHWVHGGQAAVPPFRAFESGKMYLLEFWATWCPHCREAVPVLASLQQRYAAEGLTVIAITNEEPAKVKQWIAGVPGDENALVVASRSLVMLSDPDNSVYRDYMGAASTSLIPTAFLVGRDGVVEWVGDPDDIEQPLRMVIEGAWDRAAFAGELKRIESIRAGAQGIEELLAEGKVAEAVIAYQGLVDAQDRDAAGLNEVAWLACELADGQTVPGQFLETAVAAIQKSLEIVPDHGNAIDTFAHLHALRGDLDAAIATQRRALQHAGPFARRIERYMQELEARKTAAK